MPSDAPRPRRSPGLAGVLGALALSTPTFGGATAVTDRHPTDPPPASAQPPAEGRLSARARPCDGRLAMVMLTVRDAAGAPVTGARLTTRRAGARAPFPAQPQEHGAGEYQLFDDTALQHLARGDQAFDVTVAHGGRRRVVRQVVGTTPGGCHVVRRSGADVVTLR